jgi:hypothetical protein
MGGFADAWEKMVLSHRFNIQKYATCQLYVGLSSSDPLDNGSGVSEPPGAKGYARVKTSIPGGTSWQVSDATGTTVNNSVAIEFPTATADWGTMVYAAIFSGGTAGASVLVQGAMSASKSVDNGDTARFAIGELQICLK